MSFLRGVKKGAGLGLGAALVNRAMNQVAQPQPIQQPHPMQHQPHMQQQAMQPQQPRQPGFLDRLAGSVENMANATTQHINSAAVGSCDYCGTGLGVGDRTCTSCCAPVGA
ncbi:MAG: hypothetical protein FWC71_02565 [Defluviitaleaceae bacterium]|nr:hypothetical protein [Defluviitaleaceae bacterium]